MTGSEKVTDEGRQAERKRQICIHRHTDEKARHVDKETVRSDREAQTGRLRDNDV